MKLYTKDGNTFRVIAFPGEEVFKGEYLLISDGVKKLNYLVQVVDINYLDVPGLIEEIVRDGLSSEEEVSIDPLEVGDLLTAIHDVKLLECELRGIFNESFKEVKFFDIPSRTSSKIRKIPSSKVVELIRGSGIPINVGFDLEGEVVYLDLRELDGSLNLITGMKGMGKSHLAKLLIVELVRNGAPVLVFDLNGEYVGLKSSCRVKICKPGINLKFSPSYLGPKTILSVFMNVLELPGVSANLLNDILSACDISGLTLTRLEELVHENANNPMVREAILSRILTLKLSGFIDDRGESRLEDLIEPGVATIILLNRVSSIDRRILVEALLNKLTSLLWNESLPPLFLFAEEAHLYVRQTYWEDIVTRMRHFGLFVNFITNNLDSLDNRIFKQLDNIFLFCFKNENDLEKISRISSIDARTIKSMVKDLPRGHCLVIGKVAHSMPFIVRVRELDFKAMGETKLVFQRTST